jgi:hypothetical protein
MFGSVRVLHADAFTAWSLAGHVDPAPIRAIGLLAAIGPADVPRLVATTAELAGLRGREAEVARAVDGRATVEALLDALDAPTGEVLAALCDLCARGLVDLDRL